MTTDIETQEATTTSSSIADFTFFLAGTRLIARGVTEVDEVAQSHQASEYETWADFEVTMKSSGPSISVRVSAKSETHDGNALPQDLDYTIGIDSNFDPKLYGTRMSAEALDIFGVAESLGDQWRNLIRSTLSTMSAGE